MVMAMPAASATVDRASAFAGAAASKTLLQEAALLGAAEGERPGRGEKIRRTRVCKRSRPRPRHSWG